MASILSRGVAARGFLIAPDSLADYHLEGRHALVGRGYIDTFRSRLDPDVCFAVTIIEHPTVADAHEVLVDELATSMAPDRPRIVDKGIQAGDIGFAGYGDLQRAVAFVRNNVFVKVESVGKQTAPVKDLAEGIDAQIVAASARLRRCSTEAAR